MRSRSEQQAKPEDAWMMRMVHKHFSSKPVAFENFAADLWVHSDPHVAAVEVTRPSRDGGRDAVGEYRIGPNQDPVRLQFALEAKCYDPDGGGVSVRMVSRLISRIKHREFGVFVTTAVIGSQPYQEVREDGHPVVFLVARDLVEILKRMGLTTPAALRTYLEVQHPVEHALGPRADLLFEDPAISVEVSTDLGSHHRAGAGAEANAKAGSPPA